MLISKINLIKVEPFFCEKIWGGSRLKKFNLNIPNDNIGEAWLISTLTNCESYIPDYKMNLQELWQKNYDNIFGPKDHNQSFPLLIKILDANDILSVQVHPDDKMALEKHQSFGKAESWYILEPPSNLDSTIYLGHNANSKSEFWSMINNNDWNSFLKTRQVKVNDFVYVPPGKVHSLTKGAMVLEVQQSSDITYRLYDFDRKESNGQTRLLHLEDSAQAIIYPDDNLQIINKENGNLIDNQFFTINVFTLKGDEQFFTIKANNWVNLIVIAGKGIINSAVINMGEAYIIPYSDLERTFKLQGNMKIFICYQKA